MLFVLAACQTQPRFNVEPLPRYDALFQHTSGWTGGDGAYSTPLSEDRLVWLFGDTFVGEVRDGRRVNARLVSNTIAVQTGRSPDGGSITFFYRTSSAGLPSAFLEPGDGNGWLWPYQGVRTPDGLYLFLLRIERTDPGSPFGFRLVDTWLGQVANPDDSPERWHLTQRKIPWSSEHRLFGSSTVQQAGFCYIFGTVDESADGLSARYMIVARVPVEKLGDFSAWRFFAGGEWVAEADRAGRVCEGVAGEFSVSLQPALNRYVLVYTDGGLSEHIILRYSSQPYGPWSEPTRVYQCPEMSWDPRIFCYGAKAHPELARDARELIVTYVANATDFTLLETDARLYQPRFLRVTFNSPPP
ncbi:MAG: DUF5005 domain-containing protein [Hyphomicrobiales bacterium]